MNEILARSSIEFESKRSTITPSSLATLDQLIVELRQSPCTAIEIGGHTDKYGEPEYNLRLSRRRAEAVQRYFTITADQAVHHRRLWRLTTVVGVEETRGPPTQPANRTAIERTARAMTMFFNQMLGCLIIAAGIGGAVGWLLRHVSAGRLTQQLTDVTAMMRLKEQMLEKARNELRDTASKMQELESQMAHRRRSSNPTKKNFPCARAHPGAPGRVGDGAATASGIGVRTDETPRARQRQQR